jgi:hypothetical protein
MKSIFFALSILFSLNAFAQSNQVGPATVLPMLMGKTVLVVSGPAGFELYNALPAEQAGQSERIGAQYVCKTEGDPAGSAHCIFNIDANSGTISN